MEKRKITNKKENVSEFQNSILEKMELSLEFADVIMMGLMSYHYLKLWINPQIGDVNQIF